MTHEEYLKFHADVCQAAHELTAKKNRDYAADADAFANFTMFGEQAALMGLVHRMGDKLRRLSRDAQENALENEGADDSCIDLVNYAILYMAVRRQVR